MKDTSIKGNGKSSIIKAPSDMPETFEAWREQLIAGQGYLDVQLNTDTTGANAGCNKVGTALNKANLLSDTTKAALELSQSDPTVNDALYALSQKGSPAEVRMMGDIGTTVTMTRGSKTLSGTVASTGYATLYPTELGDWTITFTYDGSQKVKVFTLEVIGIVTVYPFVVGNSLKETSWSDLSIMSKFGVCDKYFKVGDTKNITVNGVSYPVRIISFNHDTLTSGGTAGITFQLVNCLNARYQMETASTNANGWEGCLMRKTTLNSTIYGQLNSDLKAVIKAVNKVSSVGNNSSGLETTSDKLFLLSEIEIFGSTHYSFAGEGKQYEYYAAGNSTIKTVSGSANYWWERSPRSGDTGNFCTVNEGGAANYYGANTSRGVSFGFCV